MIIQLDIDMNQKDYQTVTNYVSSAENAIYTLLSLSDRDMEDIKTVSGVVHNVGIEVPQEIILDDFKGIKVDEEDLKEFLKPYIVEFYDIHSKLSGDEQC